MMSFIQSLKLVDSKVKWLSFISILSIIMIKFPFIPIDNESYWSIISRLQDIFLNIFYSTFAGCIFYYFTIHIPYQKRRLSVFLFINNNLVQLINSTQNLVPGGIGVAGKFEYLPKNEIIHKLNDMDFNKIPYSESRPFITYSEYIGLHIQQIDSAFKDLMLFKEFLGDDLIEILSHFNREIKQLPIYTRDYNQFVINKASFAKYIYDLIYYSVKMGKIAKKLESLYLDSYHTKYFKMQDEISKGNLNL
jgi:hypothetical protein